MIWFLAPLAVLAAKAVYDASKDDSHSSHEADQRRQRAYERDRESAREVAREQEQQRQRRQNTVLADACQQLAGLHKNHSSILGGTVSAHSSTFNYAHLHQFAQKAVPTKPEALLDFLRALHPGVQLSAAQQKRDAEIVNLTRDIEKLEVVKLKYSQGEQA
jgi:hypothetical protein